MRINQQMLALAIFVTTGVYAEPVLNNVVSAKPNAESVPIVANSNSSLSAAPSTQSSIKPLIVSNTAALQQADDDYTKLQALKRQAAIKEQQDKLKPPVATNNSGKSTGISETIATNIVVDTRGTSFATLQFLDGSTLDVEPGTKVGKYTVSSIDLTGVRIVQCGKKNCSKPVLIKRAYPMSAKPQIQQSQSTAIFTSVNNNDTSTAVPPISAM